MIFLQGFIKFDKGISEKRDGQNYAESGIIRIIIITRIAIANKAIADITPPHYFGTSVSTVTPF